MGVLSVRFLAEPKINSVVRDPMLAVDGPLRETADLVRGRVVTTLDQSTLYRYTHETHL